jgi:hypothetical protein
MNYLDVIGDYLEENSATMECQSVRELSARKAYTNNVGIAIKYLFDAGRPEMAESVKEAWLSPDFDCDQRISVEALLGETLSDVKNNEDEIVFYVGGQPRFRLFHNQDCCESVTVEDVVGDLGDLVGSPILMAEEVSSQENPPGVTKDYQDSFTWTFYKIATIKGYVTIRWYGESNGYYSESVDFGVIH